MRPTRVVAPGGIGGVQSGVDDLLVWPFGMRPLFCGFSAGFLRVWRPSPELVCLWLGNGLTGGPVLWAVPGQR